jgi:peptidoglycan/xylan/chitin deacetylase (PgdA/CDA1 family)
MSSLLTRSLAPGGRRARHQVLIFHRVLAQQDAMLPNEPDRAQFDALIGFLNKGFNILPLPEALDRMASDTLPPASLSITFDDGYADNATQALPVLRRHGVSATFFIATRYLDGGRMWNDTVIESLRHLPAGELDLSELGLGLFQLDTDNRSTVCNQLLAAIKHRPMAERQALADGIARRAGDLRTDLMMTGGQVRELAAAGMTVGAHTHSHPILACLADDEARREIGHGREVLESLLGERVDLFAYPNGKPGQDYDQRHVDMLRELGFRAGFSTKPGVSRRDSDRWQLPRFTPWDRSNGRFLLRLQMNRYGLIR